MGITRGTVIIKGKEKPAISLLGDGTEKDLSESLKNHMNSLRREIHMIAGYEELPDSWKRKIKHELSKTALILSDYKGERLAKYNKKQRMASELFCKYADKLDRPYTKHHNPADYFEEIAEAVGYTPDHVRRLYKSFSDNWEGKEVKPDRLRASIILGMDDYISEGIFNDMF